VAPSTALRGVGIDIEPALPLSDELLDMIATPGERRQINGDLVLARLLFCIKEATYKVTHPIDGLFSGASRCRSFPEFVCRVNQFRIQRAGLYDCIPEADCSGAFDG
jgi:hypothetical protein